MKIHRAWLVALVLVLSACGGGKGWHLTNISGVVPDLEFRLTDDSGRQVSAADYRGQTVMLFFGYTNCPDTCPTTLAKLAAAMRQMGESAQHVRVLFVSVDPKRDTLAVLHRYVRAFGPRITGLRGGQAELQTLAKRYRITYSYGKPDADGNYEVTHSSAVFVFDARGKARLMILPGDSAKTIAEDLKRLVAG